MTVRYAMATAGRRKAKPKVKVHWPNRIVAMRERTGLTQKDFAALVGVSSKTLENWEQGRRQPTGPAAVLLAVLEREPGVVIKVVGRG
jgi:putative transcriptional regulator